MKNFITYFCCLVLAAFTVLPYPLYAQDNPAAAPVGSVDQTTLPTASYDTPVVIELFSSQACVFCPQADALLAELIQEPDVIGISCHIDYFDVREGALSHPFCTTRQDWYVERLGTGPNYTPQMVIQGHTDRVGYHEEDVRLSVEKSRNSNVHRLQITPLPEQPGIYTVTLPEQVLLPDQKTYIWVALYDGAQEKKISEGQNRNKTVVYKNVISAAENAGAWNGSSQTISIEPKDHHKGFAVIVQNEDDGHILAAGKYLFGTQTKTP